jgi:4-hydroxyphenylpyruvate dioxygenase
MAGVLVTGIDHIRFVVGNARQSAYFYRNAFGFEVIGYAGLETGMRQESGYVLRQGNIILVLASPLKPSHQFNNRLSLHGDGVADIAFAVEDVEQAYVNALQAGAVGVRQPETLKDAHGTVEYAVIKSYGDTTHTLINRAGYAGLFMPGYLPIEADRYSEETGSVVGLKEIDHIVGNVETGQMNRWIQFYENVMDFDAILAFDKREIKTQKNSASLARCEKQEWQNHSPHQ